MIFVFLSSGKNMEWYFEIFLLIKSIFFCSYSQDAQNTDIPYWKSKKKNKKNLVGNFYETRSLSRETLTLKGFVVGESGISLARI